MATHGVTHDGSHKYFTECVVREQFRRTDVASGPFQGLGLAFLFIQLRSVRLTLPAGSVRSLRETGKRGERDVEKRRMEM